MIGVGGLAGQRTLFRFVLVCGAVLFAGGCKNSAQIFVDQNEGGGWFSKPVDVFAKPDWARPNTGRVNLGPQGPVGPEDLVSADGQCASPSVATPQAAESPSTQTAASDEIQKLEPTMPQVAGGIALGMTECQTVQRAGIPSNVAISAGDKGERRAVLTFLSGPWPGIYTFADGRLKVIDRAPEQPKPAAPDKKTPKKKSTAPKTANQNFERSYVQ